jgi:hypothetical protein
VPRGTGRPTERFFIDSHGPDDEAVRLGIAWLKDYAQRHGLSRAGIFVYGLQQVQNLGRVLGDDRATRLARQKELPLGGVTVQLLTTRGRSRFFNGGPILGIWVDSEDMWNLDGLNTPAICAIPWLDDGIDDWKATWAPIDIVTGQAADTSPETVVNPVVVEALKSLTGRVNLSTGLGHPSDKAAAVHAFTSLRKAGEPYDPAQVRTWAARHGWSPKHASELGEIARKVREGRTLRTQRGSAWREDIVTIWRESAAASGADS